MSNISNGSPAFPHLIADLRANTLDQQVGMSLRDWFAGQVLASIASYNSPASAAARRAYEIADAMLVESSANASLIAAAPEMLEALKALQLQALQSNVNDPANEYGREALVMAQVAIDKAEGK